MPSKKRTDLENWLQSLIFRYDERILPLGTDEILMGGETIIKLEQKGRVLPLMDSLIAATALAHNLVLVTNNEADFKNIGITVLNVWKKVLQKRKLMVKREIQPLIEDSKNISKIPDGIKPTS